MTCQYARCDEPAKVALRFGDGTYQRVVVGPRHKQSLVRYCDSHAAIVRKRFNTCDEEPVLSIPERLQRHLRSRVS